MKEADRQTDEMRTVLTELVRLKTWRDELGEEEAMLASWPNYNDERRDRDKELAKKLRQYGREKKVAWERARAVLDTQVAACRHRYRVILGGLRCDECGEQIAAYDDRSLDSTRSTGEGMRTRKYKELHDALPPKVRAEAERRAASLLRQRACFPRLLCEGDRPKWAVFHDHAEYMKDFDPDNAIFVAACDACLPAALRQDPAAHNYLRQLIVTAAPVVSPSSEPLLCSQCGQPFDADACGPTHALIAHERITSPTDTNTEKS